MHKKNISLEKEISNNKAYFENLVTQYKNKIDNLISFNDSTVDKLKDMEKTLGSIQQINNNLENENKQLSTDLKTQSENFISEKTEREYYQNKCDEMEDKHMVLINLLRNIDTDRQAMRQSQGFLFERLKYFYNNY